MIVLTGIKSTTESVLELVGVLIIFIIVLVVCVWVTRFVANRQIKQKRQGNFEVVETFPVSQNKYLQLVRAVDKYIVISICKDSIGVITEVNGDDVIFDKPSGQYQLKNFQDVLSKCINKSSKEKNLETKEESVSQNTQE